ncbi:cell division cycle-associated 7-like protein isoform X2 [Heptranchias perlo]|uniref:cell division cycle-associated 7-like protein isoform X2 n=1 Tax=Heptranchias perlo TaxID=212740 RepID=UPI003559C8A9
MAVFCSAMSKLVADIFNTQSDDEEFMGFQESDFRNRCEHLKHIPKLVADIFDAPSDDEFMGFQEVEFNKSHDYADNKVNWSVTVPSFQSKFITEELIEVFTDDTCSADYDFEGFPECTVEPNSDVDLRVPSFQSKFITEELIEVFTDDTCSADYDFEGFPECTVEPNSEVDSRVPSFQSKFITEELIEVFTDDTCSADYVFEGFPECSVEPNGDLDSRSVNLEVEDEDEGFTECEDDDEDDDAAESSTESEMEATPKKGHFGLRVAFKFPTRRPAKRKEQEVPDSESESDDDSGSGKKNSNVLLKRAMNIKENKEMLAKLMAELKTMPGLFPMKVRTSSPPKQKRTPKRTFSEGKVERRVNPTRSARPPEGFSVEKFAISPTKLMDQVKNFRLRTGLSNHFVEDGSLSKRRRRSSKGKPRPADDITEEDLENVAVTVKDKIYDRCMGNTCHQCRQKTIDTKTICRNQDCYGVRGQFCGPCLRNRYGENVKSALLNPDWVCPPCRGICNCSFCRRRDGRCATGILVHLAKFYGYDNVRAYLESLQKQLTED